MQLENLILLDNGHGSQTPGKRSPVWPDGRQLFEWQFNRDIVSRIHNKLADLNKMSIVLVPETSLDVSLTERANRTNRYATYDPKPILISVHVNAMGMGPENPATGWSAWTTKGYTEADVLCEFLYKAAEKALTPKGFKLLKNNKTYNGAPFVGQESDFTILTKSAVPAVLTENLFMTNRNDCNFLLSEEGKEIIADLHVNAILAYFDSKTS